MRTMKASEFKAKCLQLMDEVAATGEPIQITKHGKPVATLVTPAAADLVKPPPKDHFGFAKDYLKVVEPLEEDDSSDPWEALKD